MLSLLQATASLNWASANGTTALMLAAHKGNHRVVGLLLKARADTDAVDCNGFSALQLASHQHHAEVVELLEQKAFGEGRGHRVKG